MKKKKYRKGWKFLKSFLFSSWFSPSQDLLSLKMWSSPCQEFRRCLLERLLRKVGKTLTYDSPWTMWLIKCFHKCFFFSFLFSSRCVWEVGRHTTSAAQTHERSRQEIEEPRATSQHQTQNNPLPLSSSPSRDSPSVSKDSLLVFLWRKWTPCIFFRYLMCLECTVVIFGF